MLIAGVVLAYANTFSAPFVFDDVAAVTQNPSLTHLATALFPPPGLSVTGRPLVNLSLALNHAVSGEAVWSYHALNLALHLANALLLFALLRLTLPRLQRTTPLGTDDLAALAAAALWALHPLQTAAVTYVMQRSELLVSLCYLSTLSAFARATNGPPPLENCAGAAPSDVPAVSAAAPAKEAPRPPATLHPAAAPWLVLSAIACLLGMAAKEVMVTAPVAILLYDRTFAAGSFVAALRARPLFYTGLAGTWLLLLALLLGTDARGASAGFASGLAWTDYVLTQLHAVALYLRLTIWPAALVFDYGNPSFTDPATLVLPGLLVSALVIGTLFALRRRPALGFAGAIFFLLLAPTSSVIPIATQTIAEHRLYLALAVPVALAVGTLRSLPHPAARLLPLPLAVLLGAVTVARNADYRTTTALWTDTVAKAPANARAHYNLGVALLTSGPDRDPARAVTALQTALRLESSHPQAPGKLGTTLLELGRFAEAVAPLASAVQLQPADPNLAYQLAGALLATGRIAEAAPHLATTVRLDPNHAAAHYNYGRALTDLGRYEEALAQFDTAARLDPADPAARANASRLRQYLSK